MEHLKRCVCVFAILSIAHGDVRDGFFVGGRFGVSSESPSYKQNTLARSYAGATTRSASTTKLSQDVKQDLQNALQSLKNLNGSLVHAKDGNQDLNSLSSISLSSLSGMQALQAKIAGILQELQVAIDNSANNGQNQAIMSQYRTLFDEFKTLQTQLTQEIDNYNQALNSQRQNYDTKYATYQKAEQKYQTEMHIYNNARNSVDTTLNQAGNLCVFSCGPSQISAFWQGVKNLAQDLRVLASLNPKFSDTQYYNANSNGINNVVSGQALIKGITQHGVNGYFTSLWQKIAPNISQASFSQTIALTTWFNAQAQAIKNLAQYGVSSTQISAYMQDLVENYQTVGSVIYASAFGSAVPPATTALGNGPQFNLSDKFNFPYQNFAPKIQAAHQQLDSLPNISVVHSAQIKPNLAPLAKSINQSSRLFSNIGYNVDLLAGYQYFFSQHFGFSTHISVGYGYIHSPLFGSVFSHLQDVKVNLGGDLIYDFNAPTDYQSPIYYGMFMGMQGGSANFVLNANNQALWRASYDLGLDVGLRLQFSSNIIKWGVIVPLIPHKIGWQADLGSFQINENAQDIGFFITYEKLIF
ncbi:hypothetical protein [Helicobacter bizzozeronii]|uniref:hypothetical protein n=1 Tax=Helicobacter bizzozeronii TaxID=56877 RepID=UPI001F36666D|nr:hypothetical protein [Helicobacter bizzozeronii]